jgi:hypothetical protein
MNDEQMRTGNTKKDFSLVDRGIDLARYMNSHITDTNNDGHVFVNIDMNKILKKIEGILKEASNE